MSNGGVGRFIVWCCGECECTVRSKVWVNRGKCEVVTCGVCRAVVRVDDLEYLDGGVDSVGWRDRLQRKFEVYGLTVSGIGYDVTGYVSGVRYATWTDDDILELVTVTLPEWTAKAWEGWL